jgi:hypothetical protein
MCRAECYDHSTDPIYYENGPKNGLAIFRDGLRKKMLARGAVAYSKNDTQKVSLTIRNGDR